jgi:hypothetical protein
MADIVRIKSNVGATEINHAGVLYGIHSDSAFYVPSAVVQAVLYDYPAAGFFVADTDEHAPPAGSVSLIEATAMILGLAPGAVKDRLVAALADTPAA